MIPICRIPFAPPALTLMLTSPAMSGEWQLGLGAEFEQYFGYVSYDGATSAGFDGADAVGGTRIYVVPSYTSDNGLRFGGNFKIEGHMGERNAGIKLDEAALFATGAFGEVWLGKSDTPGNHMHYGAPESFGPDVNFAGLSTGTLPSFLQFSDIHSNVGVGDDLLRGSLGSTLVSNSSEDTAARLTYFTPRMGGFQFGASYAPDGPNSANNRQDFFDLGANYMNDFGGVEAALSAKWGVADTKAAVGGSPEYWGVGLQLSRGDFTVGGSYVETSGSAFGRTDGRAYDIGASYQRGRYGFSVHYLSGQNTDDENLTLGSKEQLEALTIAASYVLTGADGRQAVPPRPGQGGTYGGQNRMAAELFGFVSFTDFSEDVGDGGIGTPGDDVDGFVIGTGFRLTF